MSSRGPVRSDPSPGQPIRRVTPAYENAARRIRSRDLFAGCPRVVIEHGDAEYHLRITRMGKLILTK